MKRSKIPEHVKCIGCGECCGPVPITEKEEKRIRNFVDGMDREYLQKLKRQPRDFITCQFRDEEAKKCAIYPVRPVICRLCGVVKGMECTQGNTMEINGKKFIPGKEHKMMPRFY